MANEEREHNEDEILANNAMYLMNPSHANPNGKRPQTPTHRISKTMMIGQDNLSNKGSSNLGVSDHDSSTNNDLAHQIGDQMQMQSQMVSDRDSNYDDVGSEDDDKRIMDDEEEGDSDNHIEEE